MTVDIIRTTKTIGELSVRTLAAVRPISTTMPAGTWRRWPRRRVCACIMPPWPILRNGRASAGSSPLYDALDVWWNVRQDGILLSWPGRGRAHGAIVMD